MNISIPGTPFHFAFDKDAIQKAVVVVLSAAGAAAFTAGEQALLNYLASDPKYAFLSALAVLVVSTFSKKAT